MIRVKVGLAIALALIEIISCIEVAQAHFTSSQQVTSKQKDPPVDGPPSGLEPQGTRLQNPPVDGRPPERYPKGTRGPCPKTEIPFTPLLPLTNSGFSGFTLTEYPTFVFYIPYESSSITFGKFSIEEKDGTSIYKAQLSIPETPGFVTVSLPQTIKPLELNKEYRWHFQLYCQSPDPGEPASVWHDGLITRVDMPMLEDQLNTVKSLEERIKLHQDNNIWYDVSTDLAEIHNRPQVWQNLLKEMDVEWLKQEPIAGSAVSVEN